MLYSRVENIKNEGRVMPNNQQFSLDSLDFNLLFRITERLDAEDAVAFFLTNRELYAIYINTNLWQKRFGCKNYQEFNNRYRALVYPLLREGIRDGYVTLEHAEETNAMIKDMNTKAKMFEAEFGYIEYKIPRPLFIELKEKCIKRRQDSWTEEDDAFYRDNDNEDMDLSYEDLRDKHVEFDVRHELNSFAHISMKYLPRINVIIALREGLIITQPIDKMRYSPIGCRGCSYLLSDNAIRLLREKLFTFDQLFDFDHLGGQYLLSENGYMALHNGLMTTDQAMTLGKNLNYLLGGNGWTAFQNGLITAQQAIQFGDALLKKLAMSPLWEWCDHEKITAEDMARLYDKNILDFLFPGNSPGIISMMIKKGLITLNQFIEIINLGLFDNLVKEINSYVDKQLVLMADHLKSKLQHAHQEEFAERKPEENRDVNANMSPMSPKVTLDFEEFKKAYLTQYQSEFFKKKSEMNNGLINGTIKSIEQVKEYVDRKPNSRAATVYNELIAQHQAVIEKAPERPKHRH